jgi:hypothetical protein
VTMGDSMGEALRLDFDRRLLPRFCDHLACGEGDFPLPEPVRGAILAWKPLELWRMSARSNGGRGPLNNYSASAIRLPPGNHIIDSGAACIARGAAEPEKNDMLRLNIRATFTILVIGEVTLTSPAAHGASQYHQGVTLLRDCENNDPLKQLPCSAYIEGVSDTLLATGRLLPAPCYPAGGVQAGQLSLVVVQFLRAHPERLYEGGARLVQEALNGAFPCTARDRVYYPWPMPGAPSR